MKLSTKILLGFLSIILISVTQGLYLSSNIKTSERNITVLSDTQAPLVNHLTEMQQHILMAGYYYSSTYTAFDNKYMSSGNAEKNLYIEAKNAAVSILAQSPELASLKQQIEAFDNIVNDYFAITDSISKDISVLDKARSEMTSNEDMFENAVDAFFKANQTAWEKEFNDRVGYLSFDKIDRLGALRASRIQATDMMEAFDMGIGNFWHALANYDLKAMENAYEGIKSLADVSKTFADSANISGNDKKNMLDAAKASSNVNDIFLTVRDTWAGLLKNGDKQDQLFKSIVAQSMNITSNNINEMQSYANSSKVMLSRSYIVQLVCMLIIIALGILITMILTNSITKSLSAIMMAISENAHNLSEASGSFNQSSQSLSDAANSQASSLEETSAALEEMSSMTRLNADNAKVTSETTQETIIMLDRCSEAVHNMTAAMTAINDSSEKISRIIKTIEGIAFQTNLLALNAAVEAARAGEAGKGFAVVADEVRNLAQSSAQAAGDTSELIAGTVERVSNGSNISISLAENFKVIEDGVRKVSQLIADIAQATHEQAQGVDQVRSAVTSIDQMTQHNATEAMQTMNAARDLDLQSDHLNEMVAELGSVIYGRSYNANTSGGPSLGKTMTHGPIKALPMNDKVNF